MYLQVPGAFENGMYTWYCLIFWCEGPQPWKCLRPRASITAAVWAFKMPLCKTNHND